MPVGSEAYAASTSACVENSFERYETPFIVVEMVSLAAVLALFFLVNLILILSFVIVASPKSDPSSESITESPALS